MLNYMIPFIERLAAGEIPDCDKKIVAQIRKRRYATRIVTDYLQGNGDYEKYYDVIDQILLTPEYRRLLLYLPLSSLKRAPRQFRKTYLDVWYELLDVQDARENFYEGDTFEVSARPDGQLERVVKCAHLTPWLIEAGYLSYADLRSILSLNQDNEVLLRSFANTWQMIEDYKLFTRTEIRELQSLTTQVTHRAKLDPLYVSEGRKKWLDEREKQLLRESMLTPDANLAGPFSSNIAAFRSELERIQTTLKPNEIVLVGGSRLKGYGTSLSDLDIFNLEELNKHSEMKIGSPHAAHVYYNTLWLGGSNVKNLGKIAADCAMRYYEKTDRNFAIERLESDLLQYRLLHKGFAKFYGGHKSTVKKYTEMDGDCPFYDDSYRRIATELYVKYVFIPHSNA